MIDPFLALMSFVAGVALLPVVYTARLNLTRAGKFDNSSYQLGMIMAVCIVMFGFGLVSLIFWSVT
jgi:hypothetical protein